MGNVQIKGKTGNVALAQYYVSDGFTGWYPDRLSTPGTDNGTWANGFSFKIYNPHPVFNMSMTNYVPDSINITLKPGWNWVGFINSEDKFIGDLISGKLGYYIKSKDQDPPYAEYYDNEFYTGWYPTNFVIKPGYGYEFLLDTNRFSDNEIITITRQIQ